MNDMERAMLALDAPAARAFWARTAPHMPQCKDDNEALVTLHMARTQAKAMPVRARAYSHRWLLDHGLPSGLPDELKPRAERLYPVEARSVGIVSLGGSSLTKPIAGMVGDAMRDAVLECYADGHQEAEIVRPRMLEARENVVWKLLGLRV